MKDHDIVNQRQYNVSICASISSTWGTLASITSQLISPDRIWSSGSGGTVGNKEGHDLWGPGTRLVSTLGELTP